MTDSDVKLSKYAYVVLQMIGDAYTLGSVAAAHTLRKTGTKYDIVCMVTNDVSDKARDTLKEVYDHVIEIDYIKKKTVSKTDIEVDKVNKELKTARNAERGKLLKRKGILQAQQRFYSWIDSSYTKWACMGLTQYEKVLLLDSDKLIVHNLDHLFELKTPAGSFQNQYGYHAEKRPNGEKFDGYKGLKHGQAIPLELIDEGFAKAYVVTGTCVLLSPNERDFKDFRKFVKDKYDNAPGCGGGSDEQSITRFYHDRGINWHYIDYRHQTTPWLLYWLKEFDPSGKMQSFLFHYLNKKPWKTPFNNEWPDLATWWMVIYSLWKEYDKYPKINEWIDDDVDIAYPVMAEFDKKLPEKKCWYCDEIKKMGLGDNKERGIDHYVIDENGDVGCWRIIEAELPELKEEDKDERVNEKDNDSENDSKKESKEDNVNDQDTNVLGGAEQMNTLTTNSLPWSYVGPLVRKMDMWNTRWMYVLVGIMIVVVCFLVYLMFISNKNTNNQKNKTPNE